MRLPIQDLGSRVVVLSPHLDDAVLSLGATIAAATRAGAEVRVLTVFAGDPESDAPPGAHDAVCGFRSAGEAARMRRQEDAAACRALGAVPSWLPFPDGQHGLPVDERELATRLTRELHGADTVLVPGFPLTEPDHRLAFRAALHVAPRAGRRALYVEQPYASWAALSRSSRSPAALVRAGRRMPPEVAAAAREGSIADVPQWRRPSARPADWLAKRRAARCYRSQLPRLRRVPLLRIAAYEALSGGERIAWL